MERAAYSSLKDTLTQGAFDLLLARLHPDRERAGEEYTALRVKMVRFFTLHADYAADDAADETFNRMARKLVEGARVENIEAYAYNVARLILLERGKKERRAQAALTENYPHNGYVENYDEPAITNKEDYYQPMRDCLNRLPEADQNLLTEYYAENTKASHRENLAARLNISAGQLRLRIFRLRARLEECLKRKRAFLPQKR